MAKLTFPYTMHCLKCKTPLKIKSPKLVGTRINCPKCKARIDVVTPDEDAVVSYGVEAPPEPEKVVPPTEEELLQLAIERKRKKRKAIFQQIIFWIGILILIGAIGGLGYLIKTYAVDPFSEGDYGQGEEEPIEP